MGCHDGKEERGDRWRPSMHADKRLTGTGVPSVSSLSSCLKHSTLL